MAFKPAFFGPIDSPCGRSCGRGNSPVAFWRASHGLPRSLAGTERGTNTRWPYWHNALGPAQPFRAFVNRGGTEVSWSFDTQSAVSPSRSPGVLIDAGRHSMSDPSASGNWPPSKPLRALELVGGRASQAWPFGNRDVALQPALSRISLRRLSTGRGVPHPFA